MPRRDRDRVAGGIRGSEPGTLRIPDGPARPRPDTIRVRGEICPIPICPCSAEERKAARPFVGDMSDTSDNDCEVSAGFSENEVESRADDGGAILLRAAITCGVWSTLGGGVCESMVNGELLIIVVLFRLVPEATTSGSTEIG